EGTFVGAQAAKAFIRGAAHELAVDVVKFAMRGGLAFVVENDVERQRASGCVEQRGFVHVVPDAGDPDVGKCFVERTPPFTRRWPAEIRKDAHAGVDVRVRGPDRTFKNGSVRIFDEMISGDAAVVGRVTLFHLGMRIDDAYGVETLR